MTPSASSATLQLLGQDIGAEVEGWATDRVRDVLKSDHYFHAIHFPRAFHMHPLNYALGLAAAAEAGRRAYLRAYAGGGDRPGRGAQAHRDAEGDGFAPPMWCSPAMSTSAR